MENTKAIYKLHADCGRQGELTGIFIADKYHIKELIESKIEVYFGEVLGKHSEIFGAIEEKDLTMVSDDPAAVKVIEDLNLETGYNPFNYTALNIEDEGLEDSTVGEIIESRLKLK